MNGFHGTQKLAQAWAVLAQAAEGYGLQKVRSEASLGGAMSDPVDTFTPGQHDPFWSNLKKLRQAALR